MFNQKRKASLCPFSGYFLTQLYYSHRRRRPCGRPFNFAVTKSGNIVSTKLNVGGNDESIVVFALDGSEIREFGGDLGIRFRKLVVDPKGQIWALPHEKKGIWCFTEDGKLVHIVKFPFQPEAFAFLRDGRMLVTTVTQHSLNYQTVTMYAFDDVTTIGENQQPLLSFYLKCWVHNLKVCARTDEIYVVCADNTLVYSTSGKYIHSLFVPYMSTLSPDGDICLRVTMAVL